MCECCVLVFFFFKQKTAYEMRISDWSSDVCSSDLVRRPRPARVPLLREIMPVYSLSCRLVRLSGLHAIDRHRGLGLVLAVQGLVVGREGRAVDVAPGAFLGANVAILVDDLALADGAGVDAPAGDRKSGV